MKYTIICILFINACNNAQTKMEIDGSYTTNYDNEFAIGNDTLHVTKMNNSGNIYQISKHLGVVKKLDGKEFAKELINETWTLEYDSKNQTLFELKSGKILSWDSEHKIIKLGDMLYKKIVDKK